MSWGNVATIGSAIIGAWSSKKSAEKQAEAASKQGQMDPRLAKLLFGENNQGGLLNEYRELGKTPRSDAAMNFAGANEQFLANNGGADLGAIRESALGAMAGNATPTAQAAQAGPAGQMTAATGPTALASSGWAALPSYARGNMVDAPSQNKIDLSDSYNRFINGQPGANPFLDQSIGGAIAQNRLGFQQLQDDATENLMKNVMPGIRSNSVLAGQYGGSRQGIAEGNAIGTLGKELARAGAQFGQNATNAAVNAKAGAYESDMNRALSATQGLGAQQYATAFKDADTRNAAEFMNVGNQFDASKLNAGFDQQSRLANLGSQQAMNLAQLQAQQQANQFNAGQAQQNNQFNAGLQQNTNLANLQSQLSTNAQNNSSALGGAGLLSGLLGQVGSNVNANDNWAITRAGQINSLLAPLIGSAPTQNPVASNSGAAALGGGLAGLSLGNSLAGMFGNMGGGGSGALTSYSGPGITASPMTSMPQTQVPFLSNF